jgi:hypothetical protein
MHWTFVIVGLEVIMEKKEVYDKNKDGRVG